MPARLIKIKYVTIRVEKVTSPITALYSGPMPHPCTDGEKSNSCRQKPVNCVMNNLNTSICPAGILSVTWTTDGKTEEAYM